MAIAIGDRIRDLVTSYEGVAVSSTEFLHGCVHIGVQGAMLEGKIPEGESFDEQRCMVIGKLDLPIDQNRTYGIALNAEVEDKITGFTGIVVGRSFFLFGQAEYIVEPTGVDDKGNPLRSRRFEEGRLLVLSEEEVEVSPDATLATSGGPFNRG